MNILDRIRGFFTKPDPSPTPGSWEKCWKCRDCRWSTEADFHPDSPYAYRLVCNNCGLAFSATTWVKCSRRSVNAWDEGAGYEFRMYGGAEMKKCRYCGQELFTFNGYCSGCGGRPDGETE